MVQRGQYADGTRVAQATSMDVGVMVQGFFFDAAGTEQSFTVSSMSLSSPGHHTMPLAIPFIREMPGCPSCSSCRTSCCPLCGTTTRFPHNIHPS